MPKAYRSRWDVWSSPEGLVRACESELSEEEEGQQHGGTMLLTMVSD